MNTNMEDIMQHLQIIIITSANDKLKDMKADIMQTLKTSQEYGGINFILERKHDQKQYKCNQCDFRANLKTDIYAHKRREHSDYKVLCDQCGYTTNNSGHFKRHFKAIHAKYL